MYKKTPIEYKSPCHKADKVALDGSGRISALCFKSPRPVPKGSTWTFCNAAVTCPRCLKMLGIEEKRTATVVEYDGLQITVIADPSGIFEEYFKIPTPRRPVGELVPVIYEPSFFLLSIRSSAGLVERPAVIYMHHAPPPDRLHDFRAAMERHWLPLIRYQFNIISSEEQPR